MFFAQTTADGIPFVHIDKEINPKDVIKFKDFEGFFKVNRLEDYIDSDIVYRKGFKFQNTLNCSVIDSNKLLSFNIKDIQDLPEESNPKGLLYHLSLESVIVSNVKLSKNQTILVKFSNGNQSMIKIKDIGKKDIKKEFDLDFEVVPVIELQPIFPIYYRNSDFKKTMFTFSDSWLEAYGFVLELRLNGKKAFL